MSTSALRLLVGKVGLDGHDRGAKIVARALRDAGCEVIYTGLHQTPEMVVNAAIQEDVDAICLSILSGAHNTLLPRVLRLLEEKRAPSIPLLAGGIIPDDDIPALKAAGVLEVFTPGASTREIVEFVKNRIPSRRGVA
jgi:methylmalonyl-CoA mutase C-terminal domain/subunit